MKWLLISLHFYQDCCVCIQLSKTIYWYTWVVLKCSWGILPVSLIGVMKDTSLWALIFLLGTIFKSVSLNNLVSIVCDKSLNAMYSDFMIELSFMPSLHKGLDSADKNLTFSSVNSVFQRRATHRSRNVSCRWRWEAVTYRTEWSPMDMHQFPLIWMQKFQTVSDYFIQGMLFCTVRDYFNCT